MMESKERYFLRKLSHADYEDLVEISKDVWEGSDYLPEVFHHWVDAPGLFMGAVDAETGRVVGTAKYTILEDGTGWLEGLRVKSDHRGHKIASMLTDAVFELALKEHRAGITPAVGYSTHVTSQASLKMMADRHFKQISDCLLVVKPYEAWGLLTTEQQNPVVEPWTPSFEEFSQLPLIERRNGVFSFAFVYQKPTRALHQTLLEKGYMLKVNGYRGFYTLKGEPNFLAVDETFEAMEAFANYALSVNVGKGKPEPLTYILGEDPQLNERLKAAGYITFNNWEKDYYYFLYDDNQDA